MINSMQYTASTRRSGSRPTRRVGQRGGSKGFTLIELLIVIVIISILAAIALPVMSRALVHAKRTRANTTIKSLEVAFKAYYAEYNEWREGLSDGDLNMNVVRMLRGEDVGGLNPRERRFIEFNERAVTSQGYVDPWGRPFKFSLDTDYDGNVTVDGATIYKSVAIWSLGPDPAQTNDNIRSWD